MHICLNRGTAGRDLPYDEFVKLSSQAGFPGVDVDMGWGQMQGAKALRDLLATHDQKPGGWGPAIDIGAFIAAIKKTGYDGPMSLEVFSADLRAMPPLDAAKKAWAATQRTLS